MTTQRLLETNRVPMRLLSVRVFVYSEFRRNRELTDYVELPYVRRRVRIPLSPFPRMRVLLSGEVTTTPTANHCRQCCLFNEYDGRDATCQTRWTQKPTFAPRSAFAPSHGCEHE
jgi:hypothetical protein